MNVRMKVLRFDLSRDQKPRWGEYEVASGTQCVHYVKWYQDSSLACGRVGHCPSPPSSKLRFVQDR
jgi:hypothetical protein